jgi:hypothetical protein
MVQLIKSWEGQNAGNSLGKIPDKAHNNKSPVRDNFKITESVGITKIMKY